MSKNQGTSAYYLALGLCFATTVAGMNPSMNAPMDNEGINSVQLHVYRRGKPDGWEILGHFDSAFLALFVLWAIAMMAFKLAKYCNRRSSDRRVADGVDTTAEHHEPVDGANIPPLGVNDIELAQMPTGNTHATTSQAGPSLTKRMMLRSQRRTFSRKTKPQGSLHGSNFAKCTSKSLESSPIPEEITEHPCHTDLEPAYKIVITHLNEAGELEKIVMFLGTTHKLQSPFTFQDAQAAMNSYPRTPAIIKDINGLLVNNAKPGLSECFKKHLSS